MKGFIDEVCRKVLGKEEVKEEEALKLSRAEGRDVFSLLEGANRIREEFLGKEVDLCAVVNAKSGRCSEDCIFCAQSTHHQTDTESFPLISPEEMLEAAGEAEKMEAAGFGIVTSGRGINDKEATIINEGLSRLRRRILPCAVVLPWELSPRKEPAPLKSPGSRDTITT